MHIIGLPRRIGDNMAKFKAIAEGKDGKDKNVTPKFVARTLKDFIETGVWVYANDKKYWGVSLFKDDSYVGLIYTKNHTLMILKPSGDAEPLTWFVKNL